MGSVDGAELGEGIGKQDEKIGIYYSFNVDCYGSGIFFYPLETMARAADHGADAGAGDEGVFPVGGRNNAR